MIREKSVKIRISFFVKACGEQLNTVVEANLDPIDEVNYSLIENNIPNNGFINKKTTDRENIHNKLSRSSSITSDSIQLLNDKNDSTIIEFGNAVRLDTVQDFLIELGIKPLMHLLEINIFSLNNDIVRLTKIMNNLVKDLKILSFKVIFQCLKLVESFQKKFSVKNI